MVDEPKPMDPKRLAKLRALFDEGWVVPGKRGRELVADLLAAHDYEKARADAAEAEVARLRARVRVEAADVERAGVTPAKRDAWMRSHGAEWRHGAGNLEGLTRWHLGGAYLGSTDADAVDSEKNSDTAALVRQVARTTERSPWEILDEMAAMEVSP